MIRHLVFTKRSSSRFFQLRCSTVLCLVRWHCERIAKAMTATALGSMKTTMNAKKAWYCCTRSSHAVFGALRQQRKDLHGTDSEAEQEWNTCHQEKLSSSQEAMGRKTLAAVDRGCRKCERAVQHLLVRCAISHKAISVQAS